MSYFKEIDAWLDGLLAPLPEAEREDAKREIKDKILESYRNGLTAPREDARGEREPQESGNRRERPASLAAALDRLDRVLGDIEDNLRARRAAQHKADEASHEGHQSQPAAPGWSRRRGRTYRAR
jgi:hypothetical protein